MKNIIRAWKDTAYRAQLESETGIVVEHPAGLRNLTEKELRLVHGGDGTYAQSTCTGSGGGCCTIVVGDCTPPNQS